MTHREVGSTQHLGRHAGAVLTLHVRRLTAPLPLLCPAPCVQLRGADASASHYAEAMFTFNRLQVCTRVFSPACPSFCTAVAPAAASAVLPRRPLNLHILLHCHLAVWAALPDAAALARLCWHSAGRVRGPTQQLLCLAAYHTARACDASRACSFSHLGSRQLSRLTLPAASLCT